MKKQIPFHQIHRRWTEERWLGTKARGVKHCRNKTRKEKNLCEVAWQYPDMFC